MVHMKQIKARIPDDLHRQLVRIQKIDTRPNISLTYLIETAIRLYVRSRERKAS